MGRGPPAGLGGAVLPSGVAARGHSQARAAGEHTVLEGVQPPPLQHRGRPPRPVSPALRCSGHRTS